MYVIGEAGTWHAADSVEERMVLAYELIATAADCGVDAVKFQCFTEGELFCPLEGDEKRWNHWKRTFLAESQWRELKEYAEARGIDFLLSAFQTETVDWCARMKLKWYKVASRAALSYPYERAPGPFLISMGKATRQQLEQVAPLMETDRILQCSMQYPTPLSETGWTGEDRWLGWLGLSDHSGTPWPAIDALARGCPVVEVHFRLPLSDNGPDWTVSLMPEDLSMICQARDAFREMRQD